MEEEEEEEVTEARACEMPQRGRDGGEWRDTYGLISREGANGGEGLFMLAICRSF